MLNIVNCQGSYHSQIFWNYKILFRGPGGLLEIFYSLFTSEKLRKFYVQWYLTYIVEAVNYGRMEAGCLGWKLIY